MRRREFIALIGGAMASWPLAARAQQVGMPLVGMLNGQSADKFSHLADALRLGLRDAGFVEGQNVIIEYRWADGHDDHLPALANDLVARNVAVIVSGGSPAATFAAAKATSSIPVVFTTGGDPVKLGFVASYNRPGRNVTGVAFLVSQLAAKRLEILHQLLPNITKVAALVNMKNANAVSRKELDNAAHSMGLQVSVLAASTESEIRSAFAALTDKKMEALLVDSDPFLTASAPAS